MNQPLVLPTLLTILAVAMAFHPAAAAAENEQLYAQRIKPVLKARCYACHGALAQESGLRVDTGPRLLKGGDSGPAVVPGDAANSLLWQRVSAEDEFERMPPEGHPLSADELDAIRQWIDGGAMSPDDEVPDMDSSQHWAFKTPRAGPVPAVSTDAQQDGAPAIAANPVDAFLTVARTEHGVTPVGPSDRLLLLRRLYLDLIGLPPSHQQQVAFLSDQRPDAYERVVDELLASPQYGERWARHWMDIWRYSDWYGLGDQLRNSQKHMWHWRDWIIESLNSDLGYDQMIVDMLAADELAPTDPDRLRATGFLARNYYLFNRTTWLDSTIEHTSQALMGLTMQCCKCHDHKYDPLSHEDYYRFRAIFEPHQVRLDTVAGETDLQKDGLPRVFDAHPDAPTYVHQRGDEKQPLTDRPLSANVPSVLRWVPWQPQPRRLPLEAHWPAARPFVLEDHLGQAEQQIQAARSERDRALQALAAATDPAPVQVADAVDAPPCEVDEADRNRQRLEHAVQVAEKKLQARQLKPPALRTSFAADHAKRMAHPDAERLVQAAAQAARALELAEAETALAEAELARFVEPDKPENEKQLEAARKAEQAARAALDNPGTAYQPIYASLKALEGPDETEDSRRQPYPQSTTGRRTALAMWLVHPDHPLTARVAVNHIWLRHFGQPLVEPVEDFGRRTPAPQHQALLDWLAVEWQRQGWSMKWLHRLLVTSATYRLSGVVPDEAQRNFEMDPNNTCYWYRPPVRMESQVIRDSILSLAGQLSAEVGGPSLDPKKDQAPYRRSLYFLHSRDDQSEFLSMFDDADILRCYRRTESVVPQQALAMANSELTLRMANHMTDRLYESLNVTGSQVPTDLAVIELAFAVLLGRSATVDEIATCTDALAAWNTLLAQQQYDTPQRQAHAYLIHALLNHNDFITIR